MFFRGPISEKDATSRVGGISPPAQTISQTSDLTSVSFLVICGCKIPPKSFNMCLQLSPLFLSSARNEIFAFIDERSEIVTVRRVSGSITICVARGAQGPRPPPPQLNTTQLKYDKQLEQHSLAMYV